MRKLQLKRLKGIVCRECSLSGHCGESVICNSIIEIENIFKPKTRRKTKRFKW